MTVNIELDDWFILYRWLIWMQNNVHYFAPCTIGDVQVSLYILSDHNLHPNQELNHIR